MIKKTRILAIETSCDETAAAVVENGREVLSSVIYSQIKDHTIYGGVVPEIASRKHMEKIDPVIEAAMEKAGLTFPELDAVAVTCGPGLVGALLVGVAEAKAISYAAEKPLIGVNHIHGHICANYIENKELEPPFLCLVISGGHTHLLRVTDYGEYEILGKSRDDAAGEAFDKVARAIGLPYPGGSKLEEAAGSGDPEAIRFPRPGFADAPYDFSFSGLKSAVLNYLNEQKMKGLDYSVNDVAASFQASVIDSLTERVKLALSEGQDKSFALAGGVASNGAIRRAFQALCDERGVNFYVPSPVFCTDNAAMIGAAAYGDFLKGNFAPLSLNAYPNLSFEHSSF